MNDGTSFPPVVIGGPCPALPEGWEWTDLVDLADLESGHTPRKSVPEYWGGDVPWISLRDIRAAHGKVIWETEKMPTILGIEKSSARLLPAGTVCFSRDISVGFTTIMGREMSTTQHFANWVCGPGIFNRYLMAALMTARHSLIRSGEGTTVRTIYFPALKKFRVALAPLAEQRRIVDKIEALNERSRAAREGLEQIPLLLERFRQSVLAAAFRGDLTAEWRAQNPNVEPASVLLERIRAERTRKSRWTTSIDESKLPGLPKGWCWATWAELADRVTVGYVGPMKKEYRPTGVPFLRGQNVRENRYRPDGLLYISEEFHAKISKSALTPGDLVVVRSGAVGTTCVIPDSLPRANCSDVVVIQQPKGVLSWYGSYYMNSAARSHVRDGQVGVALTHFNTKSVANLPIAVPPIAEQEEIVRTLDERMAATRLIEEACGVSTHRLSRLDQSILAKAFRGELVPQDPKDEPASVLLERLRAEREAAAPRKKSKRKKAKAKAAGGRAPAKRKKAPPVVNESNGTKLSLVLEALKRDALHRIADGAGIEREDRRSLAGARAGLVSGGATLKDVLQHLHRDELKTICCALDLDDRGREKSALRLRITRSTKTFRD